jgi:hypothetical protein
MNTKWYLSTLLVLLIFLGTIQENNPSPNQEIVLEFTHDTIKDSEKEHTIIDLKNRLQIAGASNIQIQEAKNGKLKIVYFSKDHVSIIKDALALNSPASKNISSNPLEDNKYPSEETSKFNIDIYEIDLGSYSSNFDGNSILEIKYDSDRFTNNQNYVSSIKSNLPDSKILKKLKSKFYNSKQIVKNSTSHNIPEVRAGPNYFLL